MSDMSKKYITKSKSRKIIVLNFSSKNRTQKCHNQKEQEKLKKK